MSEKCITFINQLKGEVEKYEAKHLIWRETLKKLIEEKDNAWSEYEKADNIIANLPPNNTYVAQTKRKRGGIGDSEWVRCADWSNKECSSRCSHTGNTYQTPLKKPTQWNSDTTSHADSDCTWAWQHHCLCKYHEIDLSQSNKLKEKYDDLVKAIHSWKTGHEPDVPIINVNCCKNDIFCANGKCYGNIQVCHSYVHSQGSLEDDILVLKQIQLVKKLFDEILLKFNINFKKLEDYYINFKDIQSIIKNDKKLNINVIYLEIKNLFEYTQITFNIIFTILESLYYYYLSIVEYIGKLNTITYKTEANIIVTNVNSLIKKATTDYQVIIKKYDVIKTYWEKMELHKKNLDTMNFKNILINDYLKNFNIGIENINNIEINSLVVNDDMSLNNLLKLIDNTNNIFKNNIINIKQIINNLFDDIKILFNTIPPQSSYDNIFFHNIYFNIIPPQSIFYNIAQNIFIVSDNTNILVNSKFKDIQEIINNIINIGITKKNNYEIQKKIIEDNNILYALEEEEEEEEQKKKSDLLLLQLIKDEEKNKLLNSYNQTTPINITDITPLQISISEETLKIDYTVYIIMGVVVILFLIFFSIKK